MISPIPHIETRKIYPQTFLIEVVWQIRYSLEVKEENYSVFRDYIKTFFNNNLSEEAYSAIGILSIRYDRENEEAKVKFTNTFAEFKFRASQYQSFETSVQAMLWGFLDLLSKCNAQLWHISCDKKNLVEIAIPKVDNEDMILRLSLKKEALQLPTKLISAGDLQQDFTPSIRFLHVSDNNLALQALYGVYYNNSDDSTPDSDLTKYGIMVESKCESKLASVSYTEVKEISWRINSALYDFIHWFLAEELIDLMSSNPEKE